MLHPAWGSGGSRGLQGPRENSTPHRVRRCSSANSAMVPLMSVTLEGEEPQDPVQTAEEEAQILMDSTDNLS